MTELPRNDAGMREAVEDAIRGAVYTQTPDPFEVRGVEEAASAVLALMPAPEGEGAGLREDGAEKWSVASGFPHTAESSAAWMDSAAMFSRNEDFYRGIVVQIGEMFGDAAKTSDDGSLQDSVLALKVPGLVAAALAQLAPVGEDEAGVREALKALCDLIPEGVSAGLQTPGDDAWTGRLFNAQRQALKILAQPPKAETPAGVERVRHVKSGGVYEVMGEAEAQIAKPESPHNTWTDGSGGFTPAYSRIHEGDKLTVYRDPKSGKLWCRFTDEFRDGRFVPAAAPAADGGRA